MLRTLLPCTLIFGQFLLAHCSERTDTQTYLDKELLKAIGMGTAAKVDVVGAAIKAGANLDTRDPGGNSVLLLAAAKGNYAVVELLIQQGAEMATANVDGWTPLHAAANHGYDRIVELLLDQGADWNARAGGKTPLSLSIAEGHPKCSKMLAKAEHDEWPLKPIKRADDASESDGTMPRMRRGYGARSKEDAARKKEEL